MRIGCGYDSHRFVEGRRLVLGGVEIPHGRGLEGWSDADAVTHAVIDALCGAAGLGDIGALFPPGDERYRDVSSVQLLSSVACMVRERGFGIANVDVTVVAQEPLLSPYVARMCEKLAVPLDIDSGRVSIKAKTNEHMGFVGRSEGLAVFAVALLE
jgi:2-C-methyl-D-erythritol 2,4-cyclodiphosphate synthase